MTSLTRAAAPTTAVLVLGTGMARAQPAPTRGGPRDGAEACADIASRLGDKMSGAGKDRSMSRCYSQARASRTPLQR